MDLIEYLTVIVGHLPHVALIVVDEVMDGAGMDVRESFYLLKPTLKGYLADHNLDEIEQNYVCLLLLGFGGGDAGLILGRKGHYNIAGNIRSKLGIKPSNLSLKGYVRDVYKNI